MMRSTRPMFTRWAAVWLVKALVVREVRDSRFEREVDEVMSGVRVSSARWTETVGCCEGRFAMVDVCWCVVLLRVGHLAGELRRDFWF